MKCEITLSGENFATHTEECRSVKEAIDRFGSFKDAVGLYGDERSAEGLICVNTDPAWALSVGPRGGIRKEAC